MTRFKSSTGGLRVRRALRLLVAGALVGATFAPSGARAETKHPPAHGKRAAAHATRVAVVEVPSEKEERRGHEAHPVDAHPTETLKRTHSGPHIEVLARDLRLDERAAEHLQHVAAAYFEATRRRLVVTGGIRTPQRQAELMYEKLSHGDDIVDLYEHKQAAREVLKVYKEGKERGLKKAGLIRAIRDRVNEQIAQGVYVSRHLKAGAADVRSRDLTHDQEAALRAAVKAEPGVILVDERESAEPHLHLGL